MPKVRTDIDMEMLRTLYIDEKKSLVDCSEILKCSVYVVRNRLNKIGCEIRKQGEWAKGIKLSKDHKKKLSLSHIGKVATPETKKKISTALRERECTQETRLKLSEYRLKNEIDINRLIELYCKQKKTIRTCAKYFEVSQGTITTRLIRNNIKIRPNKYIDIELFKKMYIEEDKTLLECSKIGNISKKTITKIIGNKIRKPGLKIGDMRSEQTRKNMSIAQTERCRDKTVAQGMKRCTMCKKILPHSEFHKRVSRMGEARQQPRCKKCCKEAAMVFRKNNIEILRIKGREYARNHKNESSMRNKKRAIELKKAAFEAYGGIRCSCCGVTDLVFLTIDHMDGGGGKHRRKIKTSIYKWLKDNNYPPGYRVLCWNCNWAEAHGGCPHVQQL